MHFHLQNIASTHSRCCTIPLSRTFQTIFTAWWGTLITWHFLFRSAWCQQPTGVRPEVVARPSSTSCFRWQEPGGVYTDDRTTPEQNDEIENAEQRQKTQSHLVCLNFTNAVKQTSILSLAMGISLDLLHSVASRGYQKIVDEVHSIADNCNNSSCNIDRSVAPHLDI